MFHPIATLHTTGIFLIPATFANTPTTGSFGNLGIFVIFATTVATGIITLNAPIANTVTFANYVTIVLMDSFVTILTVGIIVIPAFFANGVTTLNTERIVTKHMFVTIVTFDTKFFVAFFAPTPIVVKFVTFDVLVTIGTFVKIRRILISVTILMERSIGTSNVFASIDTFHKIGRKVIRWYK
jgi:hypothetical protein